MQTSKDCIFSRFAPATGTQLFLTACLCSCRLAVRLPCWDATASARRRCLRRSLATPRWAPVIVDALLAGLDRLKREDELALVVVEQHAMLALELAENAVILDRGTIVYSGASRMLIDAPERLAALIGVGGHLRDQCKDQAY